MSIDELKPLQPLVLLEDEPVDYLSADWLQILPFARVIAGAAAGTRGPFTIGVYADWGEGKTSVLKLSRRLLKSEFRRALDAGNEEDKFLQIVPVWFNAWQFERDEHPIVPLVATIVVALEKRKAILMKQQGDRGGSLQKGLSSVSRALRAIAYGFSAKAKLKVPGLGEIESGFIAKEMIERYDQLAVTSDPLLERSLYYRAFDLLAEVGGLNQGDETPKLPKVVVFIDDLDRCLPP